jgi:hypothetical protein
MSKNKLKISIYLNILITLLVIFATVVLFSGFKFMKGGYESQVASKIEMLKFFTIQSNIFMGIVSYIFAIEEIKVLREKKSEISIKMYILKLMATTSVMITFLTIFAYLGPITDGGTIEQIKNSNLFFHFLVPVLSMLCFTLFDRTDKLKLRYVSFGIAPTAVYAIYYIVNVLLHIENGKVSPIYDWYWFIQGGLWQIAIVTPVMLGGTYVISLILWRLNRKRKRSN